MPGRGAFLTSNRCTNRTDAENCSPEEAEDEQAAPAIATATGGSEGRPGKSTTVYVDTGSVVEISDGSVKVSPGRDGTDRPAWADVEDDSEGDVNQDAVLDPPARPAPDLRTGSLASDYFESSSSHAPPRPPTPPLPTIKPDRNQSSADICRKFQRGSCLRGQSCWYVHVQKTDHQPRTWHPPCTSSPAHGIHRSQDTVPIPPAQPAPDWQLGSAAQGSRKAAPCLHFARGYCRLGSTCRFEHNEARPLPEHENHAAIVARLTAKVREARREEQREAREQAIKAAYLRNAESPRPKPRLRHAQT